MFLGLAQSAKQSSGVSARASTFCWPTYVRKTRKQWQNTHRCRFHGDHGDGRCFVSALRSRSCRDGHGIGRGVRRNPCGRCFTVSGLARNDPQGRSLWRRARAGGIRQRHCTQGCWRGDCLSVWAPSAATLIRAKCGPCHHASRRPLELADASARSSEGLASRLSTLKARELVARDGRSGSLGSARGTVTQSVRGSSSHRSRMMTERAERAGLSAYAGAVCGWPSGHTRRSGNRWGASDGSGRRVHHR